MIIITNIDHERREALGLNVAQYCVYNAIEQLQSQFGFCNAAKSTIAKAIKFDERTLKRNLKYLIENDLVTADNTGRKLRTKEVITIEGTGKRDTLTPKQGHFVPISNQNRDILTQLNRDTLTPKQGHFDTETGSNCPKNRDTLTPPSYYNNYTLSNKENIIDENEIEKIRKDLGRKASEMWLQSKAGIEKRLSPEKCALLYSFLKYRNEIKREVNNTSALFNFMIFFSEHSIEDLKEMMKYSANGSFPDLYTNQIKPKTGGVKKTKTNQINYTEFYK